jgi:hypothetical protein
MIANVVRGKGFRGLLDYLLQPEKAPEIVASNMAGLTARELAREFGAVRSANEKVKTPVFHCSLSLPVDERLDKKSWAQGAERFLKELGLSENRPWLAVRHADKDHDHIHVMTSRTAYDGKVWYGEWEVKKVLNAKAVVEKELGLSITPRLQPELRISKAQLRNAERMIDGEIEGEAFPSLNIAKSIDSSVLLSGGDHDRFLQELKSRGIDVKLNKSKSTGRVSGASFSSDGGEKWTKGSQLGKSYKWAEIAVRIDSLKNCNPKNEISRTKEHGHEFAEDRVEAGPTAKVHGRPREENVGSSPGERTSTGPAEAIKFPVFATLPPDITNGDSGEANCSINHCLTGTKSHSNGDEKPTPNLSHVLCDITRFTCALIDKIKTSFKDLSPLFGVAEPLLDQPEKTSPEIII